MTRGFVIFAHNNEKIDYTEIALCNARMIRKHSECQNITLVTDKGSLDYFLTKHKDEFTSIIVTESPASPNRRRYLDTSTSHHLRWNNSSRASAYDLSPYDETIVLDADYLIMDRTLDHCWGTREPFMINSKALTLDHQNPSPSEIRLEPMGIDMYWATVIYFRKSDLSRRVFEMVEHVRVNYDYYQSLYRFPGNLFRNDYAFSIAIHLVGGWTPGSIPELPQRTILTSFDRDELIAVDENSMTFLVGSQKGFHLVRVPNTSVHVMNKFSISRLAPNILETFQ